MRLRHLLIASLLATSRADAQEALRPPTPFLLAPVAVPGAASGPGAIAGTKEGPAPGALLASVDAADRALEMGFSTLAAQLYTSLLNQPGATREQALQWRSSLVTALLEAGQLPEAEKALQEQVGVRGAAWQLRAGLIAAYQRRPEAVRAALAAIRAEELAPGDRSWHFFLQGLAADAAGDLGRSSSFFELAVGAAVGSLARTRFQLAREQAELLRGAPNLETLRTNAERFQGQKVGYGAARLYAVALDAAKRKDEAVAVLQRLLISLPAEERAELDQVRLLLGLVAGAGEGSVGRNALYQLLATGFDPEKQRNALQLLARASASGNLAAELRRRLDEFIAAPKPHPIRENLLLYRAEVALTAGDYVRAEGDARDLLDRYPGSQLRAHAYSVLTGSAWQQRRYRTAADHASKARAELPAGAARAQLGVLVAEAWFRAGDFRNAADAYAEALTALPPGVKPGELMFQRVLAEIEAGRLDAAGPLLDSLARDPAFDRENRWRAEWNLARSLQIAGQTATAYERVTALLAPPTPTPDDPALRARMAWLQARLSLDAGKPSETVRLVEALLGRLEEIPSELRAELASSAALLRARAQFALAKAEEALSNLDRLRKEFPRSDAAVYSLLTEADHFARQDRTVDAQQRLTRLADMYPDSNYAPYALYQAALLAERRGQDSNLEEANKLIEQMLKRYPESDLVFYARLKQGDLFRRLNEFALAQQAYEELLNKYPRHGEALAARMALADCHGAQVSSDPVHAERAAELYEGLVARPDATPDLRVEAGYKLGASLARRGQTARAAAVWWRDVAEEFLLKPDRGAKLGAQGRYWMGRTLIDLGGLFEQQEKLEEARRAWRLVVDIGLPGAALAQAKLARFLPPAETGANGGITVPR